MKASDTASTQDDRLDALLGSQPVAARSDFTQSTLARIQEEKKARLLDTSLDALLATQPVSVSADFTERTVTRIHREAATQKKNSSRVFPWAAAMAALLALAFVITAVRKPEVESNSLATAQEPLSDIPAIIVDANTDPEAIEKSLWLARELDGAEAFLDDEDWAVIPLLVDY